VKKIITLLMPIAIGIFLTTSLYAQAPQTISYQAVIRNTSGDLVPKSQISMRISILQGSAETETSIYTETLSPVTNSNGLVSIEIGAAINSEGDFSAIDWADGPYFIKTEINPTYSTSPSYPITGTSQLLSVPYALHAKTAESYTGQTTQEAAIALNTAKVGVTVHAIGDSYGGGIIFWLDETGEHGLVAATEDQSTGIQWYNGTDKYTGATSSGLYAGEMNTAIIVASQMTDNPTGNFAAKVCAVYSHSGYGDWYLPSETELLLLYDQKDLVGNFYSTPGYWSSSESSDVNSYAWKTSFDNYDSTDDLKSDLGRVRAIRSF
jgi:hypothetical protein